ncbi:MAG: GNAT family N-acetyltransferase [Defluviitaleaceae bacterium]|nr:GNAT family N-acetyltransferase [Defluviitaleaceae bacterium]
MKIRKATPADAEILRRLYHEHLTAYPPKNPADIALWREKIARFESDAEYHLLVGEVEGRVVSTVTLVVIENLTRNLRPYAVIENVVTHADFRGKGCAAALMQHAGEIAQSLGCYKIMLSTGSKTEGTLQFYEKCGFNCRDKTGFVKWLEKPAEYPAQFSRRYGKFAVR